MSIQIVEIAQPSVIDTVAVAQPSTVDVVEVRQGPAGPAGPNSVTSATTSDGTANLSLATATVSGTLTAPTAATTTSTTQVATTAFVQQELASGVAVAKNLEFLAHNGSGATIAKGSIVYINGAVSGVPRITKSQANNDTNSARTIGFVKADIANGSNGFVIIEGEIENVSTADSISIVGAGIQLYLSPTTPGAFTRTKPSAPSHMVYVGVVVTASTGVALDGKILVGIQNGYELDEIHDVSITAPVAAKQVVKRNAGNTLWINSAIVSADVSDATDAATANTLVLRDANGNASFGQIFSFSLTVTGGTTFGEESLIQFDAVEYYYGDGAASAHRIALGAGTTGATLFGAADAAAARTTLGLATTDSVTFTGITASGGLVVTSASYPVLDVTRSTAATGDFRAATRFKRANSSGTSSSGMGVGCFFEIPNAANVLKNVGFFGGAIATATAGAEIGELVFSPAWQGADPYLRRDMVLRATSATKADLSLSGNLTASGTLAVTGATTLGATTITSAGSFTIGDDATASLNATLSRNGAGVLLLNATNAAGVNIYGKLQFSNDNAVDIGNVATNRPRNLYVGTGVFAANITASGTVKTGGYTFATLPTPTTGMRAYITDGALAPVYMANATSGSTVITPVFYNGTNWINA